jgi:hypothetical protein
MQPLIQIGKPVTSTSVREMFQQLAQREADEIRRLKQGISARPQQ